VSGIRKISGAWASLWQFLCNLPEKRSRQIALTAWALFGVVVFTIVAIDPIGRSATKEYQDASTNWWKGEKSLYRKKNGYLYLPQEAMLYTPYNLLPKRLGEPLWRLTCLGLLGFALWSAARHLAPQRAATLFLIATVLVVPCSLSSARNGQVNMPLAALFVLTALALARERWQLAAILLTLTLVLKPIAVAPILVCAVIYPGLRKPLGLWIFIMLALAFAHPYPRYVLGEYHAFFTSNLSQAGNPKGHSWCDFAGMLETFHIVLPPLVQLAIRALAGLFTLIVSLRVARAAGPLRAAMSVLLLCVVYLMLFNPRTETNSYVMLGIWVALLGAYDGLIRKNLRAAAIWTVFAVILGAENYGNPIFPWTNLWLKALVTLALGIWLSVRAFRLQPGENLIPKIG